MSLTITGILTIILSQIMGDVVSVEDLETFINVSGLVIGAGVAWYGRWRHGDITIFGTKKE